MQQYCSYSFTDLFVAALGRKPTSAENAELAGLPREKRNERVRELASRAGWKTKNVISLEGDNYTAFWPKK